MELTSALRLLAALSSIQLAACGALTGSRDPYWLKDESPRFPSTIDSLTAYHAYVWNLTAAEWPRESDLVRETVACDGRLFQRVRQAIVAAAPAAPHPERARAQQLLEKCEGEARNDASLRSFIALLRDELAERRRLEERARDETRRADALDQKLRELKAIEVDLLERARPAGVRKP